MDKISRTRFPILIFILFLLFYTHSEETKEKSVDLNNPIYAYRALKVIQFLIPAGITDKEWIRLGSQRDGGYVMIDDFSEVEVAYSLGVGNNWSWDTALTSRGIKVYMFDPTIRAPLLNNFRLKYYGLGIASHDSPEKKFMTLESLMRLDNNFNKTNMIFKMDVEGAEWDVLYEIAPSILEKFSQILLEFHNLNIVLSTEESYKRVLLILEKLNRTHQMISFHPCNCVRDDYLFGKIPVPNVFEVSYVKRNAKYCFDFNKRRKRFDERCNEFKSEVFTWWLEGKMIDFDDLLDYYERISKINMQLGSAVVVKKEKKKEKNSGVKKGERNEKKRKRGK